MAIAEALSEPAPGVARFPTRSELAALPPATRRRLVRLAFETPLRGQRLRQLRSVIRRFGGCLGALPDRGRRALELRAGFGGDPVSRRVIARRIGVSPMRLLRLERSSLRTLIRAGERGLCGSGDAVALAIGGLPPASGDPAGTPTGRSGGSDSRSESANGDFRPAGSVLADVAEGGPGIDFGDGEQGPTETLLLFLLALFAVLAPSLAMAIAAQRRGAKHHHTRPAR